jgi:glyoxylase-like metal-dependent hydrolase (beta-lactamase superfamily II)
MLRTVLAPNASPLTLDGTRTHILGRDRVIIIDPGSDEPSHLDAVVDQVGQGSATAIVVTHDHPDHAAGADELAERLGAPIRMARRRTCADGDRIESDAGDLVAIATPGHTNDHMALHWPDQDACFCGDLMMGGHDTSLVAPPEGRLGPYLASLDRIRALRARIIYPAHGAPFSNPENALDRYVRHRQLRLDQVRRAIRAGANTREEMILAVYGEELDPELAPAAGAALKAYLEHLQATGRIRRRGRGWEEASS